jgi:ABC-2 type transport system ATP-binding protein
VASDISALRVRGLTKRFGTRPAVSDLDLDVEPGTLVGFLGPNGAGKTTALRCILGLTAPDAGTIEVFGETDPVAGRRGVGALVETPAFHGHLSGRTCLELTCGWAGMAPGDIGAAVRDALARTGLADRADDPVRSWSLGMRQRLGIARALVTRPRLLVLDEPTNGLDPRGMHDVRALLVDLARRDGVTILMASHLLAEVQGTCTHVAILKDGRLEASGRVDDLLSASPPGHDTDAVDRVTLVARPAGTVREVLAALHGVTLEHAPPDGAWTLSLRGGVAAPDVARAIVAAGAELHALVPETRSLEALYLSVTERGAATDDARVNP